ncbi:calcium-binding protein [Leptolyngbya sp. FACHB-541]|uniref:calcium-binding protein n=1 Tax=Leptolyngbya sp. FACHB-541 TaxID=2692810 RepID=UPI00321F8096
MNGALGSTTERQFLSIGSNFIIFCNRTGKYTLYAQVYDFQGRTVEGENNYFRQEIQILSAPNDSPINIFGDARDNRLVGNARNNRIEGRGGHDTLIGDTGNDILLGGAGNDRLIGGLGRDRFTFDINSRYAQNTIGSDVITDFTQGQDKIVLDRTTFKNLSADGLTLTGFATVRTLQQAQQSRALITYIRSTGTIFYNENRAASGFGFGGQFADLRNGLSLSRSDITVVA